MAKKPLKEAAPPHIMPVPARRVVELPGAPERPEGPQMEFLEPYDLLDYGTPHDDTPSVTHHSMHPGAIKDVEDVGQWYSEKRRISIASIQMPTDDYTLYVRSDQDIDRALTGWALIGLLFLAVGVFL